MILDGKNLNRKKGGGYPYTPDLQLDKVSVYRELFQLCVYKCILMV